MFDWLLDADAFVTRNRCGQWTPPLILVYQLANLTIALSYYAIPLALLYLWRTRRAVLPRPHLLLWFSSFIFLCGTTHVLDFVAFWWAPYRFFTVIDLATAFVSVVTACILPGAIQYFSRLPTPEEYSRTLAERDAEITMRVALERDLVERQTQLEEQCTHLQNLLDNQRWATTKKTDIEELKRLVEEMRSGS